ncbi:MAG: hypothetical protein KGM16_13230 [Bacteroidota bacterium]|nr:hypothetical protein [Bacteroidota bacterium]
MTISKPYLTFLISFTLSIIGLIISYLTNWIILIPIFFGLGIPLVNIDQPLKQKIGQTIVIIIVSIAIFIMSILTALSFDFDKYIFPGLLAGLAGVAILGINGLLIKTIKSNFKTIALTFFLSGFSVPFWILMTENILSKQFSIEIERQFGVMFFWMTLTTIGVCLSIKTERTGVIN